ncbi:PREDICTED: putative neural-cadherin 2, partial [Priapulus caudatus]|uniref:Neural-cadherin 2 n=1 Tax=Priapulus caudatus TaxID=37621 RepID=A0ABM1F2Z6_PRICU
MYDLETPGKQENSSPGCGYTDASCTTGGATSLCGENGECVGSMVYGQGVCACFPGWQGLTCDQAIAERYWDDDSYVRYSLKQSVPLKPQWTDVLFRFRTVVSDGMLFYAEGTDVYLDEFVIVQITNGALQLAASLGSGPRMVALPSFVPDDGAWHT